MAENGKLPLSSLTAIGGGLYLEARAAAAWAQAKAAVARELGIAPFISSPDGAYRDYAGQVRQKQLAIRDGVPNRAATPGTSKHGMGVSLDINNIWQYKNAQLDPIMARFGFSRNIPLESWHYTHNGSIVAGTSPVLIPGTATPVVQQKDVSMFIGRATNTSMYLQTDFGRAGFSQPSHVQLFERKFKFFPGWDDMLQAELDIINSYVIAAQADFRNWLQASQNAQSDFLTAKLAQTVAAFPKVDAAVIAERIGAVLGIDPKTIAAAVETQLIDNFLAVDAHIAAFEDRNTAALAKVGTIDPVTVANAVAKQIGVDPVTIAASVAAAIKPEFVQLQLKNQLK